MTARTLTDILDRHQISVADELLADVEVPALTGPQRQGDVGIWPHPPLTADERERATPVPPEGIHVVRGEATGNTHILSALDGPVLWLPAKERAGSLTLGWVEVTAAATGYLVHTDEHGANGMAPGCYELTGKREQADIIRRVAD